MVHVLYGINLISKEKMGAMSSYDPKVIIFSLINDKFRVIVLWVTHIWFHFYWFTGTKSYDRELFLQQNWEFMVLIMKLNN